MSETRVRRPTVIEQAAAQNPPVVAADGEILLRYRTVNGMLNAATQLANKALPTKESRIHIARCVRALKPYNEEYAGERQHIQKEHAPDVGTVVEGSEQVAFKNPIGMGIKLAELDDMVIAVKLPARITDAMLPVNSKASPNNEDGLAAIITDLGPLYEIDE